MNHDSPLHRSSEQEGSQSFWTGRRREVIGEEGQAGTPPPPRAVQRALIGDAIQVAMARSSGTVDAPGQTSSPPRSTSERVSPCGSWADRVAGVIGAAAFNSHQSVVSTNLSFENRRTCVSSDSSGNSEFTDSDSDDDMIAARRQEVKLLIERITILQKRAEAEQAKQVRIDRRTRQLERARAQALERSVDAENRIVEAEARCTLVKLDLERNKRSRALIAEGAFPRPTKEDEQVCGETENGVTCCICLEKRRRIPTFRVCLHACVCVPCLQGLLDKQRTIAKCPLCCADNDGAPLVILN